MWWLQLRQSWDKFSWRMWSFSLYHDRPYASMGVGYSQLTQLQARPPGEARGPQHLALLHHCREHSSKHCWSYFSSCAEQGHAASSTFLFPVLMQHLNWFKPIPCANLRFPVSGWRMIVNVVLIFFYYFFFSPHSFTAVFAPLHPMTVSSHSYFLCYSFPSCSIKFSSFYY